MVSGRVRGGVLPAAEPTFSMLAPHAPPGRWVQVGVVYYTAQGSRVGLGHGDHIPTTAMVIGTRTDPPHESAAPPDTRRLRVTAMAMLMTP